jgi:hypothetical protein
MRVGQESIFDALTGSDTIVKCWPLNGVASDWKASDYVH